MLNTSHKIVIGVIGTGIAEWMHRWSGTLAGIGTFVFMMMCVIEKWPVVSERVVAGWRRIRSWLPLLAIAFVLSVSACKTAPRTEVTTPSGVKVRHNGEVGAKPLHVEHTAPDGSKTVIDGATSPTPPTPTEEARAVILKWYNIAALALLIAAAVAVWRGYTRAAVCFGVAALAAPLLGNFGLSQVALVITAAFVCAALAYVSAWFAIRHKLTSENIA